MHNCPEARLEKRTMYTKLCNKCNPCNRGHQRKSKETKASMVCKCSVNLCSELSNSLLTLKWVKITTTYSQLVFRIIKLPPDLEMGQDHHHIQSTCVQNYQTPSWPWNGSRSPPHTVNLCSELSNSLLTLKWVKITTTYSQLVFRIIKLPPDLDMGQDHHHIQSNRNIWSRSLKLVWVSSSTEATIAWSLKAITPE